MKKEKEKLRAPELLVSRIETPDGTILTSRHVHDYVTHEDAVSKEHYFLDGGREYQRYSVNKVPFKDVSIWTYSKFEDIRKYVCRGTLGKDGSESFHWVSLCDMSEEHLFNCLTYNVEHGHDYNCLMNVLYMKELIYRYENNISIKDKEEEDDGK